MEVQGMCPCLHSPWSPPLELPMAFWWWGVLYSFYSSFFKTLHGRWVLEYLFSPQSIILLVHNSTAHGDMDCVRSAQQIRWRWGWGDWCGLEDRRAEHVLPATCRPDMTTKEKPIVPVRIPPTCVFSVHLWHPLRCFLNKLRSQLFLAFNWQRS